MDASQSQLGKEKEHLENASSDEIRDEIRGTRREMNETLDELGDRLHPRHLLDDVIELFRGGDVGGESREQLMRASKKVGRGIAEQVKGHPVPMILAGVALARWIYESANEDEGQSSAGSAAEPGSYPPGEWESEPGMAQRAQGAVLGVAHKVSDTASAVSRKVGAKVSGAAGSGMERVREGRRALGRYSSAGGQSIGRGAGAVRHRFQRASEEHPLSMGAACLVAGLLAGLLVPRSPAEDEWMGDAADRLRDETKSKGEELMEKGKGMAAGAASAAMDEAEARGLTPGQSEFVSYSGPAGTVITEQVRREGERGDEKEVR